MILQFFKNLGNSPEKQQKKFEEILHFCYELARNIPERHLEWDEVTNETNQYFDHKKISKNIRDLRDLGIKILSQFNSSEVKKKAFKNKLEDLYINLSFNIDMGPRWLLKELDKTNSMYDELKSEKEAGMSYRERKLEPVIIALAQLEHDSSGYAWISGEKLQQVTSLFPHEINDVVTVLKDSGFVDVRYAGGTAPFVFETVSINPKGRLENNKLKPVEKIEQPKMVDHNLISSTRKPSKEIFIVHGRDEVMKQLVARTLEKLDLDPIILHEKPNMNRTLIQKFHDHSNVSFAVILLSADDMGYSKEEGPEKAKPRARQNVIFELGFFLGKLGRRSVVVLHQEKEGFDMPSDYAGVLYIPFDNSGSWKFNLAKELIAFGHDIDTNKLV
ncbi:MAG: nucleotide-binding protein [Candidatus Bathyarchaeia archaeon]